MTPLWMYPEFYERVMEPDEEDAWAEHDRRCDYTPFSELGSSSFGAERKAGSPWSIGDGRAGLASRLAESSPNARDARLSPDGAPGLSPSASGLLLLSPAARTRPSSQPKEAA